VTVTGEPVANVHVSLREGRSISGVVLFEMQRPPDLTRTRLTVTLQQAPTLQPISMGAAPSAQVEADGRFTITGAPPGRYLLRAGGAGGMLKSAVLSGRDTLDYPLEFTAEDDIIGAVLTFTDKPSELLGALTDSAGQPASGYSIVAAATDDRFWAPGSRRLLVTRPGPDGRYALRGLPAGSYFLSVVTDIEPGAQYDPEFLRSLRPQSVIVTVLDGATVQQDLRVR
jgi:hypothetical protein